MIPEGPPIRGKGSFGGVLNVSHKYSHFEKLRYENPVENSHEMNNIYMEVQTVNVLVNMTDVA